MIKYIQGDIFQSPSKVLVNTVNTQGVMGKGIALKFKQLYPDMFKNYQIFCEKKQFDVGMLWLYKTSNKWILNFPTKKEWKRKSELAYIEAGLKKFVATYQEKNITSISFPRLGCGNGGLRWEDVKPMMEHYLKNLPIDIYIYEGNYLDSKEYEDHEKMKEWLIMNPQGISFEEFLSDLSSLALDMDKYELVENNELRDFWTHIRSMRMVKDINYFFESKTKAKKIYNACIKLDYITQCKVKEGSKNYEGIQLIQSIENIQPPIEVFYE